MQELKSSVYATYLSLATQKSNLLKLSGMWLFNVGVRRVWQEKSSSVLLTKRHFLTKYGCAVSIQCKIRKFKPPL